MATSGKQDTCLNSEFGIMNSEFPSGHPFDFGFRISDFRPHARAGLDELNTKRAV
jgi:hypothetical protein